MKYNSALKFEEQTFDIALNNWTEDNRVRPCIWFYIDG